jgi:hypothetical protein
MTEQELRFVENQFKKIGIAEAFTSGLIEKMKNGEQQITHAFMKMYDGDEAKANFYLKKPDTSNLYFLNKYELTIRKDGQANEVSRAFYLNNFKRKPDEENKFQNNFYTTFTFKAAFNYLSGRPVLNTYQNQNGETYQSWDILNAKKILPNGKMEEKHYHENYGFDLEKVLKNYSIKELTNSEHKERLLQSLQRGNLQSVTFIGTDAKAAKLSISPDIPLGALKVYDENRTRIPTEKLVESGHLGKELAEKIQLRIESFAQNGKQSQKQERQTTASPNQSREIKEEGKQKQQIEASPKSTKQNNKLKKEALGDDPGNAKQTKKQKHKIH